MAKKQVLGKGLGALIKENQYTSNKQGKEVQINPDFEEIPLEQIETNPYQPRTKFDEENLYSLSQSIMEIGVIAPITVKKSKEGKYVIISGERRFRASKMCKKETIPAYIRDADNQQLLQMAIVENIQRTDLNPIEIALGYQRLIEECGITQDEMAQKVSQKRTTVTNYLRLLRLLPQVQHGLKNDEISMGHARAMINIENPDDQTEIYHRIIKEKLSVRRVEEMVRNLNHEERKGPPDKSSLSKKDFDLSKLLDTNVTITKSRNGKGKITVDFYSPEDFERILGLLKK